MQLYLADVEVRGAFPELVVAESEFRSAVAGRTLSLAEVYAAAGRLEAAYAKAGYVLVRIAIPPQKISERGILRIDVIDGSIEAIDDTGLDNRARAYLRQHLAKLIGAKHVRLKDIERHLTLAGNGAGLSLRSALRAGTHPGTTRLVVAGTTRVVTGSIGWDNSLPASLGGQMVTANIAINNIIGLGEQISLTTGQTSQVYNWGKAEAPFAYFGGAISLPLGHNGVSLSANYLRSRTLQTANQSFLNSLGHYERAGASLNAVTVAGHERSVALTLGVDTTAQRQALPFFGVTLNRDLYTSLRLGIQSWRRLPDGGFVSGALRWSQGLGGRAMPIGNATPFSQVGAQTAYDKLDGWFSWHARLDPATSATVTLRGQTGFGAPLFVSEKLALAATDGISGTLPGSLDVDSGLALRHELSRDLTLRGHISTLTVSPFVFASVGFGWSERQAQSAILLKAQSLGAGVRMTGEVGVLRPTLSLEYGRCFCENAQGSDSDRLNLAVALGF